MSFFKELKNNINKAYKVTTIKSKKYAPPVLIAVGTAGLVWAGIEAYKAKDKVNATLDKYEAIEESGGVVNRRDVAIDIAKDVSRPILIAATSVTSITAGVLIYNNRLKMLTAALAIVTEEHERYRSTAREVLDEEAYQRLETEVRQVANPETGELEEKKFVPAANNSDLFSRWFQHSEKYASDDVEYNESLLKDAQEWAESKINRDGVLLYGDLMEYLGFSVSPYQLQFGWHDTDGFYLDWMDIEVFDQDLLAHKIEFLVKWKRPRPLYS